MQAAQELPRFRAEADRARCTGGGRRGLPRRRSSTISRRRCASKASSRAKPVIARLLARARPVTRHATAARAPARGVPRRSRGRRRRSRRAALQPRSWGDGREPRRHGGAASTGWSGAAGVAAQARQAPRPARPARARRRRGVCARRSRRSPRSSRRPRPARGLARKLDRAAELPLAIAEAAARRGELAASPPSAGTGPSAPTRSPPPPSPRVRRSRPSASSSSTWRTTPGRRALPTAGTRARGRSRPRPAQRALAGAMNERSLPAWSLPADAAEKLALPAPWPGAPDRDWAFGGSTGAGVRVCILDSGVEARPPDGRRGRRLGRGRVRRRRRQRSWRTSEGRLRPRTACAGIVRSMAPDVRARTASACSARA